MLFICQAQKNVSTYCKLRYFTDTAKVHPLKKKSYSLKFEKKKTKPDFVIQLHTSREQKN